jgi:hypothetical protein
MEMIRNDCIVYLYILFVWENWSLVQILDFFKAVSEIYFISFCRDCMVVEFTTTCEIYLSPLSCEFESRSLRGVHDKHYVIKFASNLRQVNGFLWVLHQLN